jgi:hypothetical protein
MLRYQVPADAPLILKKKSFVLSHADHGIVDFEAKHLDDLISTFFWMGKKVQFCFARQVLPVVVALDRWQSKTVRSFDELPFLGFTLGGNLAKKVSDRVGHRWHMYVGPLEGLEKTLGVRQPQLQILLRWDDEDGFHCGELAKWLNECKVSDKIDKKGGGGRDAGLDVADKAINLVKIVSDSLKL